MSKLSKLEQESLDLVDQIKSALNVGKVKKLFRIGTEAFIALQPFIEKPTYWNGARALLGTGRALVDDFEFWTEHYFESDAWVHPYNHDFNATIMQILCRYPFKTIKTSSENSVIRLIDLDGAKVGWIYQTKLNVVENIYVESEKAVQARESIKRLLWEQYHSKPLIMRYNKKTSVSSSNDEPKVIFEIDDAFQPLPSAKATEYSAYLKNCLNAGVSRSVMLYGPPGTGKSTMARTLVNSLGLRSFRIRIEDLGYIENSTIFEAITIFQPEAVILDDFDRAHAQVQLLETLEFFQRHVKLVVATVNDKNNLDEALLRPGRFDELVLVDSMDEGVVKHMLGEYSDGYEEVKKWPIAFINEYIKRRKFMAPQDAARSMKELARRVARLDKYRDDESWEMIAQNEHHDEDDEHADDESEESSEAVTPELTEEDKKKDQT